MDLSVQLFFTTKTVFPILHLSLSHYPYFFMYFWSNQHMTLLNNIEQYVEQLNKTPQYGLFQAFSFHLDVMF